jgi:hypothetical protein
LSGRSGNISATELRAAPRNQIIFISDAAASVERFLRARLRWRGFGRIEEAGLHVAGGNEVDNFTFAV